jgi:hypothetical protein
MPNTLVHLGVQSVSTKAVFKDADFKWIAIGCIIPDVPWIIQRIILVAQIGIDPFDLRQYVTVQASLFCCFLLCGVMALFSASSTKIFLLLAANSLVHLLLDAMQIKWANGVHFFAPFSWQLVSFDFVWPEHDISYVFTAAGFIALVYFGRRDWKKKVVLTVNRSKYAAAVVLLAIYFILPFWLRFGPDQADNHYIATLRNVEERPGRYLELDRSRYRSSDNTVEIFSGERIKVTGDHPSKDAILSVKGYFSDNNTVHVSSFHIHSPLRDASSKIALAGVLLIWLMALMKKKITVEKNK